MIKREPVVLPLSILAGLHVIFGGLAVTTGLGGHPLVATVAACGNLAVAAVQTGIMFWVRGQVTPVEDVDSPAARRADPETA